MDVVRPLIGEYLWHCDPFALEIAHDHVTPHLAGRTEFRDNLEDEWLIVYVLFELTRTLEGLVATVKDSDGQFLLIEAAHVIPKWLQPDTSENRVFISNGELHIVPIPQTPAQVTDFPTGVPSLPAALELVRRSSRTRASNSIQTALKKRLNVYPEHVKESIQFAHCYVPAGVALVLHYKPELVTNAVRAFCERDRLDMKSIRYQKFHPPRQWIVPHCVNISNKARDLGMKLTAGFEILCSRNKGHQNNLFVTSQWKQYEDSLRENGYFNGEIKGSKQYSELLHQAKTTFISTLSNMKYTEYPGEVVHRILSDHTLDEAVTRAANEILVPESDDAWLNVSSEDLNKLLEERAGIKLASTDSQYSRDGLDQLEDMTTAFKSFVGKVSDMEGAEFPDSYKTRQVYLDADTFADTVSNVLDETHIESESEDESEIDEDEIHLLQSDSSADESDVAAHDLKDYMAQMDKELSVTEVGKSFKEAECHDEAKMADVLPVDVDLNLVKNILESYASQEGLAGPASNLFGSMGITIPNDVD
ncbi:protein ecdysoneless homolog [Corticium candelabrum]|uniref:protein ecdysoneless homolog n=1 Tax=Corticium candelabrum TaxID=121492 RepID=UPI002E276DA3|nr:protein ecdysoneless homolog [Corticium candelabrum]